MGLLDSGWGVRRTAKKCGPRRTRRCTPDLTQFRRLITYETKTTTAVDYHRSSGNTTKQNFREFNAERTKWSASCREAKVRPSRSFFCTIIESSEQNGYLYLVYSYVNYTKKREERDAGEMDGCGDTEHHRTTVCWTPPWFDARRDSNLKLHRMDCKLKNTATATSLTEISVICHFSSFGFVNYVRISRMALKLESLL